MFATLPAVKPAKAEPIAVPGNELRAIKWFTLTHALGLVLFVTLMAALFWYLHLLEAQHNQQAMYRDIEWAQQSMRLKWRENQDRLMALANDWAQIKDKPTAQNSDMRSYLKSNPEVTYLALLDERRFVQWVAPTRRSGAVINRAVATQIDDSPAFAASTASQAESRAIFSAPFTGDDNEVIVELHAPVRREQRFVGTLIAAFSLNATLTYTLPREVQERYQISIVDQGGNLLVSTTPRQINEGNFHYELPLDPPGHGIRLRAYAYLTQQRIIDRTLLFAIAVLSLASIASLGMLWRHARRRLVAEFERDRLFTLSIDLMAIMRRNGGLDRVNPAFDQCLGPQPAGTLLSSLAHPDDRQRLDQAFAQLAHPAPGYPAAAFEARFRTVDRQWRWLRWSIRGDREASSNALYAVANDTTERKLAETALAAETSFRRAMEDSMATGMRALDMDGRITYVNRAFCQMLGLQESDLLGKGPPYAYWPTEDRDDHAANLATILAGKAPPSGLHVRVLRKGGMPMDVRMYVSALIDQTGQQTGWMTSMTDITEPTRIREELAAAQERFVTVLDELDAAVSVAPITPAQAAAPGATELLFVNRTYRRLFGAGGGGHVALSGVSGETREPSLDAPLERYVAQADRWFEVRSRDIRWVDERSVRMIVATDITRRREAEEQQRRQMEKLQVNSRLVTMGEMASSLAHELNQPLTAIANYCMGLTARVRLKTSHGLSVEPAEMLDALSKTAGQAERAGKVIRRIREFVKRSEPDHRDCEIATIIADTVGLAEIDARQHSVRLHVRVSDRLPTLSADPVLIEQVLLNLIKNGIDSMRQSAHRDLSIVVHARAGHAEFLVTDKGQGIADEIRDKLFEPFFTTKAEGMGMGLNICRSIVEAHKGRLWVNNNPGGGCTFGFTLPLDGVTVAAAA